MTALALLVIIVGIAVALYAFDHHVEEVGAAPRRTPAEPLDFATALRPIGGARPTADERWGDR